MIQGVERVGSIISWIDDLDEGKCERSWNSRLNKHVYRYTYQVQVRFGEKDGMLKFRTVMDGKVVGTADIRYDRQ